MALRSACRPRCRRHLGWRRARTSRGPRHRRIRVCASQNLGTLIRRSDAQACKTARIGTSLAPARGAGCRTADDLPRFGLILRVTASDYQSPRGRRRSLQREDRAICCTNCVKTCLDGRTLVVHGVALPRPLPVAFVAASLGMRSVRRALLRAGRPPEDCTALVQGQRWLGEAPAPRVQLQRSWACRIGGRCDEY